MIRYYPIPSRKVLLRKKVVPITQAPWTKHIVDSTLWEIIKQKRRDKTLDPSKVTLAEAVRIVAADAPRIKPGLILRRLTELVKTKKIQFASGKQVAAHKRGNQVAQAKELVEKSIQKRGKKFRSLDELVLEVAQNTGVTAAEIPPMVYERMIAQGISAEELFTLRHSRLMVQRVLDQLKKKKGII